MHIGDEQAPSSIVLTKKVCSTFDCIESTKSHSTIFRFRGYVNTLSIRALLFNAISKDGSPSPLNIMHVYFVTASGRDALFRYDYARASIRNGFIHFVILSSLFFYQFIATAVFVLDSFKRMRFVGDVLYCHCHRQHKHLYVTNIWVIISAYFV